MSTQDPRKHYAQKIVASELFRDKALYQNLLQYLVDSSIKGLTPKEVTVAHDVFQKGKEFNAAEDATVRVHMHNLRNRLEQYYQSEGASDDLKLFIPKGHYRVKFVKNERPPASPRHNAKNILLILLSILFVLLLTYVLVDKLLISKPAIAFEITPKNNRLWTDFFNNDYPAFVVVGDFLIFHEWAERLNRNRRIQDYEINTQDELQRYIEAYPDYYPMPWNLGELPHNVLFNMLEIAPIFYAFHQEIKIAFTTEIDINFIKNRNIIYIGEFKNLRVLSDLVATLPVQFETLPWWHGELKYKQADSLVTLTTARDWTVSRYVTDLGIVARLPGHNNENYVVFAGFGYDAQIKLVEMLSHKNSLQAFEERLFKKHGDFPPYFVAAFEVKGFDRAGTTAELKYFSAIDKKEYLAGLIHSN